MEITSQSVDPRIRRTRSLLQQALEKLLQQKDFDKVSVQDIAEAATVNRVTFYDHYTDKFALLECVVGSRFQSLLSQRQVEFGADCSSALRGIVLAVFDYLASTPRIEKDRQRLMEPHLESAVISVVRKLILEGLRQHPQQLRLPPEIVATAVSWAIYGAAQEWVRSPNRCSSEEVLVPLVAMVAPMLAPEHQSKGAH